ncbi:MAG: DNA alkylation repair protein [Nanoarchaeota archaeon]
MILKIKKDLQNLSSPSKARVYAGFFKTGKGEYGEEDVFLGITVPDSRRIAIKYRILPFAEIKKLLYSKIHEERLVALLILVHNFQKGSPDERKSIFNFYLENLAYVNNWDLVDLSADKIIGSYLLDKDKMLLYKLAKSKNLWERRISMIATYTFIKNKDFEDALRISEMLLDDEHDLIHKAVGWMLREVGNRNLKAEESFLNKHYKEMSRTTLRYAIEKFPEEKRNFYLRK